MIPQNPGFYPDKEDTRDYQYDDFVAAAADVPEIDWDEGFDIERDLGITLKRESQNGSSSCVAQSVSSYAEVLNYVDTKKRVELSARDLYSRIHIPRGGAYLRDGVKTVVKRGISLESLVPSYDEGRPPSEEFMRVQSSTVEADQVALKYKGKSYYAVAAGIDRFARAIKDGHGLLMGFTGSNPAWSNQDVRPPKDGENKWGHAVYGVGYGKKNGKKYIKFLNSWSEGWGDNGCGYVYEDYFKSEKVFSGWVLIDQPNKKEDSMRHVIDKNKDQWLVSDDPKVMLSIADEADLERLGVTTIPVPIDTLEGYVEYRGGTTEGIKKFFNL